MMVEYLEFVWFHGAPPPTPHPQCASPMNYECGLSLSVRANPRIYIPTNQIRKLWSNLSPTIFFILKND